MHVPRRDFLRLSGLVALSLPVTACDGGFDDTPDPLSALADAAESDAAAAKGLDTGVARQVAKLRSAHAAALRREVNRANRPPAEEPRPQAPGSVAELGERLTAAGERASGLLPDASPARAELLASVAAGCTGALALHKDLGKAPRIDFTPPELSDLSERAVESLQQALASEYAALWVYGQVTAFLPESYDDGLRDAVDEHRDRRNAARELLSAGGQTPQLAEAAYLTPEPVTNSKTAKAAIVVAETDTAHTWHGVVARTDDSGLRAFATAMLSASATRLTRWRKDAKVKPSAVALPGIQE